MGLTLRSPEVTREIQRGAEVMAARARTGRRATRASCGRAFTRPARSATLCGADAQGTSGSILRCAFRHGGARSSSFRRCSMGCLWSVGASGARASAGSGRSAFPGWRERGAAGGVGVHSAPAGEVGAGALECRRLLDGGEMIESSVVAVLLADSDDRHCRRSHYAGGGAPGGRCRRLRPPGGEP